MILSRDKSPDTNHPSPSTLVMSDPGIFQKNDVEILGQLQASESKVAGTVLVVQTTTYNAFYSLMQSGCYTDANTFLEHLVHLEKTYQEAYQETLKSTG